MTKARDLASIPAGSGDFSVDSNTLFVDASTNSVGVGTNAPNLSGQDKALTIKTTNSNSLVALELEGNRDSDGNTIGLIRGDNNGNRITQINFVRGANANDGKIRFYTTSAGTIAEAATFNESGNLVFPSGQGIDFGASTSGASGVSASSTILDDYEEGTWTPAVSSGTLTYNQATYTKVGNLVTVRANIASFSDRTTASGITFTGLPFSAASTNRAVGACMARYFNVGEWPTIYMPNTGSNYYVYNCTVGGNWLLLQHNHLNSSNSAMYFTFSYITA